jgi:hypothetical protein
MALERIVTHRDPILLNIILHSSILNSHAECSIPVSIILLLYWCNSAYRHSVVYWPSENNSDYFIIFLLSVIILKATMPNEIQHIFILQIVVKSVIQQRVALASVILLSTLLLSIIMLSLILQV